MSKLYSKIDNLDLTSIIAENEFTDKFKESDTKYCKECFNPFIGEGDVCESCQKRLADAELEETSEDRQDVLTAVKEINDRLAMTNYYDLNSLERDERKDLILDTLTNIFGSYRLTDDFVRAVCNEFDVDYDDLFETELTEVDNNAYVVYINTDKGPSYLGANGETLDVNAALKFNNEDQANESLVDMVNKSANPNAGNYKVAKVDEVAVREADENADDIDPEVTDDLVDDTAKNIEVKDEEPENIEPTDGEKDKEDSEESDDEEDELEDTLDDIEDDIEEIQKQISDLKAGLEGLDKTDDVSDEDKILVDGKEYTRSSAESEIKSLEEKLNKLSKDKNGDLSDAPLDEREVSVDEARNALNTIKSIIEDEGSISSDVVLLNAQKAIEALGDEKYDDVLDVLETIEETIEDEGSIDGEFALNTVNKALEMIDRLTEAIATVTTVDNIDQESKDKKIIDKAIKLTKKEKTIDNDTFRQLRLELADKDYDVIDRLKDYALVRGEDVIYTWLRAEDKNLKESDELKVGDKFENENGVTVEIISIDADKEGNDQCTYKMTLDGRDTFKCYAPENVANMLRDNHYTKLNESVNIDIVDGDVTVTTDTTNIHVSETGEPAADLGSEPIIDPENLAPVDEMPAEESVEEVPEELPEAEDFKTFDELARENGVEFATPEQTNTLDQKAKDAVKAITSDEDEETDLTEDDIPSNDLQMEIYELIVDGKEVDDQDIETNIKETLDAVMADHADLDREDIEEFIRDKAEEIYSADEEDNSEEIAQLEDRILDYERNGRGSEEQYQRDLDRLHELRGLDEDGMQVNDIPSKNDQDHRHRRIELAKLESEDKTTYRVSYLNEDDDELAGWDIDAKDDDEAIAALDQFNGIDVIADDLLNAEFNPTGIDGVSAINYDGADVLMNADEENIITINRDGAEPIIIKGGSLEEVMSQLIKYFMNNKSCSDCEETPAE